MIGTTSLSDDIIGVLKKHGIGVAQAEPEGSVGVLANALGLTCAKHDLPLVMAIAMVVEAYREAQVLYDEHAAKN